MLDGEEKKDCSSPPMMDTGTTPDPLAKMASQVSVPSASAVPMPIKMEVPSVPPPPHHQHQHYHSAPSPAVAEAPAVGSETTTYAGVPNPIMAMATTAPLAPPAASATDPKRLYSPIGGTQTVDDPMTPASLGGVSVVPSPLASPILTHNPLNTPILTDSPSRPASTLTVGTSASTMDAMASAIDGSGPIVDSAAAGENCEPPRRKRANTIHWAGTTTTAQITSTSSPLSPISLKGNESLQPVNFGDDDNDNNNNNIRFSPGIGGPSQRKLSNASSSASSLGLRTSSSNSLYSEHSEGSGTSFHNSVGSGSPTPTTGVAVAPSSVASGGVPQASAAARTTTSTRAPTAGTRASAPVVDKRQKRLERNRESARASRRRRKQYLEELELKVTKLSEDMDRGRFNHACVAVRTITGMRLGKLREAERILLIRDGKKEEGANNDGGSSATSAGTTAATAAATTGGGGVAASHPASAGPSTGTAYSAMGPIRPPVTIKSGIQHNVTPIPRPLPPVRPTHPSLATSLEQATKTLTTNLSRTSDELQIVQTFMKQQLMSLVQPTSTKFMLWLSLQKDGFYRGGRSASERLSAARIGERMLHGGTYRAAPNSGMWPLTCHEIGLSYDQEDRIRQTQRAVLADSEIWIHRHTALATQNVVQNIHDTMGLAQVNAKKREQSLMSILTPEQRVKFLGWASKRKEVIRKLAEAKLGGEVSSATTAETAAKKPPGVESATTDKTAAQCGDGQYKTSPERHVAANLYIIDHLLSKVKQRAQEANNSPVPYASLPPNKLKKLSRRPSFESLAGYQGNESDSHNSKLSRETSFPSTGSLKRSLNDAVGGSDGSMDPNLMNSPRDNGVTPESAQVAGQAAVMAALKDVLPIIPKHAWCQPPYSPATAPMMVGRAPIGGAMQHQYPAAVASQPPQAFQPMQPMSTAMKAPQRMTTIPANHTHPLQPTAAAVAATTHSGTPAQLPPDDLVDDIPMPTPVSVLLRTSDDFISSPVYEQQEPLESVASTSAVSYNVAAPDFTIPEQVASFATFSTSANPISSSTTSGLLANRHQSAPDFTYPSLLPAPMASIPESSNVVINNPSMSAGAGAGTGDIVDEFGLADLPMMEADDWAIGEGFDMDIDQGTG